MKEKLTDLFKKSVSFVKKNPVVAICVCVAIVLIVAAIIIVSVLCGQNESHSHDEWGVGITEGIPEFDGELDEIEVEGKRYCAAYYSDVTGEAVSEYIAEIESACNVSFDSEKYPRSVVYGDRIIAVHYNVTEKLFSVTVVSKTIEENT